MSADTISDDLVREIARAMFINEQEPDADKTLTQEKWKESRADYKKTARRLLRTLERRGKLSLELIPEVKN